MYSNAAKIALSTLQKQNFTCYRCRCLRPFSSSSSFATTRHAEPIPFKDPKPGKYNPPTRRIAKIMYALLLDPRKSGFDMTEDRYVAVEDLLSHPDLYSTDIFTVQHIARSDVQNHFHFQYRVRPRPSGIGVGNAWVKARLLGEDIPKTDIDVRRVISLAQILRDSTISIGGNEWDFIREHGIPRPDDKSFITLHERLPPLNLSSFPPRKDPYTHIYVTVDPLHVKNTNVKMYYLEKTREVVVARNEDRLVVRETDPVLNFTIPREERQIQAEEESAVEKEARDVLDLGTTQTPRPASPSPPASLNPPTHSQPAPNHSQPSSPIPQAHTILLPPESLPRGTPSNPSKHITKITITSKSIPYTPPPPTDQHLWNRAIWKEVAQDVRGLGIFGERYFERLKKEEEEEDDMDLEMEEVGEWEWVLDDSDGERRRERREKMEGRKGETEMHVEEKEREREVEEEELDELVMEARRVLLAETSSES